MITVLWSLWSIAIYGYLCFLRVALIIHRHAVVVESSMIPLVMFRLLIFLHRIVLIAEPV